jgi:hypothetical protein
MRRIDGMKRLASHLTWWHMLPHKSTPRSTPQKGEASQGAYWHRCPQEGKPDLYDDRGVELIEERIRTEPERFAAVLGTRPAQARILIEASTDGEWVASHTDTFVFPSTVPHIPPTNRLQA